MLFTFSVFIFATVFQFSNGQTLPEGTPEGTAQRTTICHGEALRASCPSGSIIASKDVYYGTKLTSTCAESDTGAGCCVYDAADCMSPYGDTSQQSVCTGKDLCTDLTVAQADTSSCGATYPNLNHYLTMEYYCVEAARVSSMCNAASTTATGPPLYLVNTDYPSPIRSTETTCTCSVETESCTAQINVYLVHFELDDGGGTCTDTQTLEINEEGASQTLACSDNTDYAITHQLTSASNYLTVTLGNPDGTNAGYIWIGFDATENSAKVNVNCPPVARAFCNDCPNLPNPAQGSVSFSNGLAYASEATYSCDGGFKVVGVATRTCQADSTWDGLEPTCEPVELGDACADIGGCVGITSVECRDDGSGLQCLCQVGYTQDTPTTCVVVDCGQPNINHTSYAGTTTFGGFILILCDSGYVRVGPASPTCQADGNWDALPTCEPVDCGALAIANGGLKATSSTTYGGTTEVECNQGYYVVGTATCLATGNWDFPHPTCDPLDCGPLTIDNGALTPGSSTVYTGSANVVCDSGYVGDNPVTCEITGDWQANPPECNPIDCTSPQGSITKGVFHGETFYSGSANVTCETGYEGDGVATCLADGNWDTLPNCTPLDCGTPTIPNGAVGDDTFYDGTPAVSCDAGYDVSGTALCNATGSWESLPTCVAKDCGSISNPAGGSVDMSAGTQYPAVATFSCDTGFDMNGVATSNCRVDGTWDNLDPQCTIKNCGVVPGPEDGDVTFPGGHTYGEKADYSCDTGFELSGVASRSCQADGTWSDTDPTCVIVDCNAITAPANGDVFYSNGVTTFGEVATFTCSIGHDLVGDASRTCEASGNWNGNTPVCESKDCGVLPTILNGAVDTSAGTTYGQQATYSCDAGFSLVGDSQRECQADGAWDGMEPTCQIMDCSNLIKPDNGQVTVGATTYNAVATYVCDAGYDINGVSSRTCQADGAWSDSAPTCELKDCSNPPYLLNGDVTTPTGTKFGATAVYICKTGFGIVGSQTVQCLETGSWDALPVCVEDCGSPTDIEHGSFATPANTLKDAEVTYSCDVGYDLVGNPVVTCQNFGAWTSAPGCQLAPIAFDASCSITEQCSTRRATCRSDGFGDMKCLCAATGEIYDSTVDTCLADCGLLTNPTNGEVTLPDQTSEGQIAVYTCRDGFALHDVNLKIRTCLSSGEWSLSAPLCVVGCPDPLHPVHGYVDVSAGRAAGDTITYSCETGYRLVGEVSRICRDDTTWNGQDPLCLIECPLLSAIVDGSIDLSDGNWEKATAKYVCDKDFALVGASTRTCKPTGQWDGKAPTCVFAIFPDVLLVVCGLLIFIIVIDVLVIIFCLYLRYEKKKNKAEPCEDEFDDIGEPQDEEKYHVPEYEEKGSLEKLENGIPPTTLITSGPNRASIKKQRNSKVAPEDEKKTTQVPRKPPVPKQEKSGLKGIPKPKPLPKGAYKNNRPFGPKVYGPEPIRFKNETVPFVPLETSEPPPSTLQQRSTDEQKEEKIADVEKLLKEGHYSSDANDNKTRKPRAEEDDISLDHLTNPVFTTDDKMFMMDYDAHETRKPITKLEDTQETFKGRINLGPKGLEKSGGHESESEQKHLSEEARKHMKTTMSAYSPTLGNPTRLPKI